MAETLSSEQDISVEQAVIPTLKDTCLLYLTKHAKKLDYILSHFFNGQSTLLLDTHLLAQVLVSSVFFLSVETIRQLEVLLPALRLDPESDQIWKKKVQQRYSIREIEMPFPMLVEEVKTHVVGLTDTDSSLARKQSILDKLAKVPFSNDLAKQTNVALTVNTIRKDSTFPSSLTICAAEITAKWKKIFKAQQSLSPSSPPEETGPDVVLSTGDIGLDSVYLLTWRQLYHYFEHKERVMVEKGAKKFSAMANIERDKRKTVLSANSDDISKHKKQKLQRIISSGSRNDPTRGRVTVFHPSRGSSCLGSGVPRAVKSTKGHSAVDLMNARSLQSTKKMKVITTSSGGVMQIPRGVFDKNKR
jgi:hypothetical protein